ncbi:MAG: signal peptide peptidase SppA [Litoreibacter sp.]
MSATQDQILDRRRMRRKLTLWRVVSFVAVGIAIVALLSAVAIATGSSFKSSKPHIARVPISGFISNSRYALKRLEKLRKDKNVKGVIVAIDSPGGTTVGGEALHNAVRAIAKEKPTVTSIGSLAASAGYMIAVASDHIVAPRTSIVGSIGVIVQYPNATVLLDKLGVRVEEIKSSPIKAEPSPFNETPQAARDMLENMLLDTYQWFADLVKERRGFSDSDSEGLLDGSVYTGKQALDRKLIDALGDENTAKQWLVEEKKLDKDLKVVTWSLKKPKNDFPLTSALWKGALSAFGIQELVELPAKALGTTRLGHVDGMLSVWQVDINRAE